MCQQGWSSAVLGRNDGTQQRKGRLDRLKPVEFGCFARAWLALKSDCRGGCGGGDGDGGGAMMMMMVAAAAAAA